MAELTIEQKRALALARARRRRAQEQQAGGYASQALSGGNEGIGNLLGAPVDIANMAIGGGMRAVNAVAGTDFQPSEKPFLGSAHLNEMMGNAGMIAPPSRDTGKQITRRIMEEVGASIIPGAGALKNAAKPVSALATLLASAVGSGTGAAVANQVAPDNALAELGGQLAGGFTPLALSRLYRVRLSRNAAEAAVPTTEELKDLARQKYDEADTLGVTAGSEQVGDVAAAFDEVLDREGLLVGADDFASGYPKLNTVRHQIARFGQGDMTVPQMQTMRKTLRAAAGSSDANEARVGSMLMRQFDDFTAPLAPPLSEARRLYHRAMKGEKLDTLRELAEENTSQYTASGFENALRNEYRRFGKRLIRGQERGFSQPEIDAIGRVSRGTTGSNTARNIGRMAPSGPVSAMASVGAPGILGTMAGGPVVGTAAAVGVGGGGALARLVAQKMGLRNAELAELLVRNGAPIRAGAKLSPEMRNSALALLMAQGSNQLANQQGPK